MHTEHPQKQWVLRTHNTTCHECFHSRDLRFFRQFAYQFVGIGKYDTATDVQQRFLGLFDRFYRFLNLTVVAFVGRFVAWNMN